MTRMFAITFLPLLLPLASAGERVAVDLNAPGHTFEGLGVQVWPGDVRVEKVIEALNVQWVRVAYATVSDVHAEGTREDYDAYWAKSDASAMRVTWDILQRHGVRMILCNFAISPCWLRDKTLDPAYHASFARWWGALAGFLDSRGMRPAFLELFNEPDGDWNGRVPPSDYGRIAQLVRAELDARGLKDVGIMGPGLAHIDLDGKDAWVEALDEGGLAALGAWSTHGWEWRDGKNDGGRYVRDCWANGFGKSIAARDPARTRPVFVTEFATFADVFHGQKPANPTDTVPWACRVVENALSFLNCGANAVVYWQAADMAWEPQAAWGLLNQQGGERPAFHALRAVIPEIPVGARVLEIGQQDGAVYAAAFRKDRRLAVALVNSADAETAVSLELRGASTIAVVKTIAFPGSSTASGISFATNGSGASEAAFTLPGDSTWCIVADVG